MRVTKPSRIEAVSGSATAITNLRRVSALAIAKRSGLGSVAYPIATAALVAITRIGEDYPFASAAVVGLSTVAGLLRLWHRSRFEGLYERVGERAVRQSLTLMTFQGATWGLMVAALIMLYGVSSDSLTALVFTAAAVAVGTNTLGARIEAVLLFQLCTQLPPLAALVWIGAATEPIFVVAIVFFCVLMAVEGVGSARAFRQLVETRYDLVGTESRLKEREERLQAIFDHAPDAYYLSDFEGTILDGNQRAEDLLGYPREELLGKNALQLGLLPPEEIAKATENLAKNAQGVRTGPDEFTLHRKDGTRLQVEIRTNVIQVQDRSVVLGLVSDITARKEIEAQRRAAEDALRRSEEQYRSLLKELPDPIVVVHRDGRTLFMNRAALQLLDYEWDDVKGAPSLDFIHPDDHEIVARRREIFDGGVLPPPENIRYLKRNGDIVIGDVHGYPTTFDGSEARIVAFRDVTVREAGEKQLQELHDELERRVEEGTRELKESHEQLRQSQKMEAIGLLAGGIAHDFNNLLTVINGYSELALMKVDAEHPLEHHLRQVHEAGEKAASLTRQLLAFSRRQVMEPSVLDLNDVVANVRKLLSHTIGEDVELKLQLEPRLDSVKVDRTQMEQVLLNLAVNARDAMPDGGRLTLATGNVELGTKIREDPSFRTEPGAYVELIVSDTGTGMDDATRERIFDPFFTTKEQGKGTGLGLSTVYGIVKQSDGYVWVENQTDRGTTFHICLPRSMEATDQTENLASERAGDGDLNKTILLVEDEKIVREFAAEVLQEQGYRVLIAQHPQEALEVCKGRTEPIDLLVTDIVMPGGTGKELAREILATRPQTKVLFMSGYLERRSEGLLDQKTFLAKPFSPGELTQKVRGALGSG